MKKESPLLKEVLSSLGKRPELRVWRVQVGTFYGVGAINAKIKEAIRYIHARNFRGALEALSKPIQAIKIGINGQSDVSGIHISGRSIWIELKSPGKIKNESDDQFKWGRMIRKYNGFYVCVDNLSDLENAMRREGLLSNEPL